MEVHFNPQVLETFLGYFSWLNMTFCNNSQNLYH